MAAVEQSNPPFAANTPKVHIYSLSRLVGAEAGKWDKVLSDLQEKERITYNYYRPLREAIIKLTQRKAIDRETIFAELIRCAATVIHNPNSQNPVTDNQACFQVFEEEFFPKIKEFRSSLLKVPQPDGTFFEGVAIVGLPHMIVTDNDDRVRYVHLYPSNWEKDELHSYLELLTIVVEEQFGAHREDLWCMGLREGREITWSKSKPRVRKKCQEAARLYRRMAAA